jgi:hypothetical protein
MNKIQSFEDACSALGIKSDLPEVSMLPEVHQKSIIAYYKLVIIFQALNEGWIPDWNNVNQYKYQLYFWPKATKEQPSGFGFSGTDCDYWHSLTDVGSRLCLKDSDLAQYALKQFDELFIDYILIPS